MIVKTLQIIWHDKLPVLSCSFHKSGTFVTSGADHEVKVRLLSPRASSNALPLSGPGPENTGDETLVQAWNIEKKDSDINVTFQGSLTNHSKAVNCVRFRGVLHPEVCM